MGWPKYKKRAVSLWVLIVVVMVVVAVGTVYTVLPVDSMKASLAEDERQENNSSDALSWEHLTVEQQQSLAPLEQEWSQMGSAQKSKWLEVAERMKGVSPEDKQRIQAQIRDWLTLTPEQRRLARQNFLGFRNLDAETKTAQWQAYRQLPEEKKQALAKKAKVRRRLTRLAVEPDGAPEKEAMPSVSSETLPRKATEEKMPATDELPEYWR